ncbi:MAG TPA: hypothetical protein VKV04_19330 [Verrucomicrobiae bacterium]|nr:hypothetical protein [Verrucomicrobiae bacterium]
MAADSSNWEAIGAAAEAISAVATIVTVVIAIITIKQASSDAAEARLDAKASRDRQSADAEATRRDAQAARDQQSTMFQGSVMSACMQEFFGIRNAAAKEWRALPSSAADSDKQTVADHYSERTYGLHFEQYHLFRQGAIPRHVYAIWLTGLQSETQKPRPDYPPLDIMKYIRRHPEEAFHAFIEKVLAAKSFDEIEALVTEEAKKGSYT